MAVCIIPGARRIVVSLLYEEKEVQMSDLGGGVYQVPHPGTTKTRLIPELGQQGAAYAQLLMVKKHRCTYMLLKFEKITLGLASILRMFVKVYALATRLSTCYLKQLVCDGTPN